MISTPSTVGELGEHALVAAVIERLRGPEGGWSSAYQILGPGDDAAVLAAPDGRVVVTTDVLVDGVHFRRDWSSARDVGRKAAAQSLADVAAMGALTSGIVVGLSAPPDLPVAWVLELADGLRDECLEVGTTVEGGDVVRSDRLQVAVTAMGDLQGRPPVTRSGARLGDVVAVAGTLGKAAGGLAVLGRGFKSPRVLVEAYRRPTPPYAAGPAAAKAGATAMCDVSDGLVADLARIAQASGVAIDIHSAALAIADALVDAAAALSVDPLGWVLTGGEDHALAACFPPTAQIPDGFVRCGDVGPGEPGSVSVDGRPFDQAGGWDHFR